MFPEPFLLILSSAGVIQTLFLSVYIFFNKKIKIKERVLLGSLLLVITIRLVKSIGWYFFDIDDSLFLNIGFAAHGFIGPIIVLYFSRKAEFSKNILSSLFIILPAVLLAVLVPVLTLRNFWYVGGYSALLYLTFIYLIAGGYLLWRIYRQKKIYFPWYRNLFVGVTIFCLMYFTNYVFGWTLYIIGPVIYAPAIYFISYILFTNHEIFTPIGDKKKYKNINLTEDQIAMHKDRIERVMKGEKPYLQSDFTLTTLSELTSIPKYLLSRFFSENMNRSFTEFTNTYRIEKAKELLVDPKFNHHKIAHIAYECGFNSLSSFNSAFRKNENLSPSEYKKQAIN